jgi:hypothetical protein
MENYEINESTIRWLKRRYKNLSEAEIIELASKITNKYLKENQERLEKQDKLGRVRFEEAIDQDFLSLKIN